MPRRSNTRAAPAAKRWAVASSPSAAASAARSRSTRAASPAAPWLAASAAATSHHSLGLVETAEPAGRGGDQPRQRATASRRTSAHRRGAGRPAVRRRPRAGRRRRARLHLGLGAEDRQGEQVDRPAADRPERSRRGELVPVERGRGDSRRYGAQPTPADGRPVVERGVGAVHVTACRSGRGERRVDERRDEGVVAAPVHLQGQVALGFGVGELAAARRRLHRERRRQGVLGPVVRRRGQRRRPRRRARRPPPARLADLDDRQPAESPARAATGRPACRACDADSWNAFAAASRSSRPRCCSPAASPTGSPSVVASASRRAAALARAA